MNVICDFIEKQLVCMLPNQKMDMLLKIRTKTGEHTFQEDVYMHTLKYLRWNNQLRPFRSLKKRVANIFQKRNFMSDDSRGTSSQSIINTMERDGEESSIVNDSKRSSIHSNWSDLVPVDIESEYRKIGPLDLSSRQPKQAQFTWVHSWKLLLWIDLLSCYSLILVYTWIYKYVYENMGMETFTINSCQVSDTWNFEYCKVAFSLPR